MRILVTGSNVWPKEDFNQIEFVLKNYVMAHSKPDEVITFVTSNCPTGVDAYVSSEEFRALMLGRQVNEETHEVEWNSRDGAWAAIECNDRMVDSGADICFAFTCGGRMKSRRTRHCARSAKEAGIHVIWVNHVGPELDDTIPSPRREVA